MRDNKVRIVKSREGKYLAYIPSTEIEISKHDIDHFEKHKIKLDKELKMVNAKLFLKEKRIEKLETELKKYAKKYAKELGVLR